MTCIICGYYFNYVEPGKGVVGIGELASWKSEFRIGKRTLDPSSAALPWNHGLIGATEPQH
jgi:hypothetical protein